MTDDTKEVSFTDEELALIEQMGSFVGTPGQETVADMRFALKCLATEVRRLREELRKLADLALKDECISASRHKEIVEDIPPGPTDKRVAELIALGKAVEEIPIGIALARAKPNTNHPEYPWGHEWQIFRPSTGEPIFGGDTALEALQVMKWQ